MVHFVYAVQLRSLSSARGVTISEMCVSVGSRYLEFKNYDTYKLKYYIQIQVQGRSDGYSICTMCLKYK